MDEVAKDYEIYAAAYNWPRDALTYLSYQREGDPFRPEYTYYTDARKLLNIQPARDSGTAFIIEAVPKNLQVLDHLRSRFPHATLDELYYPDGSSNVIAYALRVPRETPTTK